MERVPKENAVAATRAAQGKGVEHPAEQGLADRLNNSQRMTAQRQQWQAMFNGAAKLLGGGQTVQAKLETAQRVEEEEPLQGKFDAAQRVEEEPLQGKFETAQGKFEAASSVQMKEKPAKPSQTGLPDNLKSGIESLSGISMDAVRVHYNSSQPAQLNAHAYAQGTDIHVAPGQEKHLPHEAWHVVQQAQGRVRPTMQMKEGIPVNDEKGLEHEADVMGGRAALAGVTQGKSIVPESADSMSGNTTQRKTASLSLPARITGVVQRVYRPKDYGEAVERHKGNQKMIQDVVDKGLQISLSGDKGKNRLHNTCEWIKNQTGSSAINIYALTPTHDYDVRTEGDGDAYFGVNINDPKVGRIFPSPPSNDIGLYDNGEIIKEKTVIEGLGEVESIRYTGENQMLNIFPLQDTGAFQYGGGIAVCDPLSSGEDELNVKLVHEMQHHADLHDKTTAYGSGGEKAKDLERYKSEVRAYTLSQEKLEQFTEQHAGNVVPGGKEQAFLRGMEVEVAIPNLGDYTWKPAQLYLFAVLYQSYPYVKKHWDAESGTSSGNREFRKGVAAFSAPMSPNSLNSRRVREFYAASAKLVVPKNLKEDDVGPMFNKIKTEFLSQNPLSKPEAQEILSSDVWAQIRKEADDYLVFKNVQTDIVNKLEGLLRTLAA